MNDDGVKELAIAVVRQAVMDYENALYNYNIQKRPEKKLDAKNVVLECELFFKKDISTYSNLDGIKIMRALRVRVRKKLDKIGKIMEVPTNDDRRII